METKPILKWAGGKTNILNKLINNFPKEYNNFHEPMVGGGAVTFKINPSGTINDINSRLTNFYKIVKQYPEILIKENKKHKNNKNYYYFARNEFNKRKMGEEITVDDEKYKVREASLLLYLNKTAYNGLFRENSQGLFNVPFGKYSNPDFVREERIKKASKILQDIKIYNENFDYILNVVDEKDFIYFDPPYLSGEIDDFTNYSEDDFGWKEHKELKKVIDKLNDKNCFVLLSNSYHPKILELYENYNINEIKANRSISQKGSSRGKVKEVLIKNY